LIFNFVLLKRDLLMEKVPLRIRLQKGIYVVIDPFVKLLIRMGLTPNAVTTIGFVLNIGVAIIFIVGAEEGNRNDLSYVGWAGGLILFAGLFDMLDGQVARLGNMSSSFGALYDSVLDRYSEMIMFFGICYYLVSQHYFLSSIFAFIALIGSMMVSYTRARAEGLGIECKDGLMQRPERVVTIGVTALACGITGHYLGGDHKWYLPGVSWHVLEVMSIFTIPIALLAVLTNVTAIKRLLGAKKTLDGRDAAAGSSSAKKALVILGTVVMTGLAFTNTTIPAHIAAAPIVMGDPQDTFPVPTGNPHQLFYLQRTNNTNTIVCELNYDKKGQLDADNPVHVFWIRFQEGGARKELNYIQRVFAYGIKSQPQGNGTYKLHFVSYKKQPMLLMHSPKDNRYHVYATINQKQAVLHRIFLKVDGGSAWSPNVVYMEMKGTDPLTGKELVERFKP
jgi:phosphatidylglycerophosphate synthase